nr:HIT family protein [Melioribacteraceae bacterium]
KYELSLGHTLVIPKRLISNYFELNNHELMASSLMIKRVKKIIDKQFNPDGYNIGININKAGGQTINHVHIHIIPRYSGDIENPAGGIRGVIPEKKVY